MVFKANGVIRNGYFSGNERKTIKKEDMQEMQEQKPLDCEKMQEMRFRPAQTQERREESEISSQRVHH